MTTTTKTADGSAPLSRQTTQRMQSLALDSVTAAAVAYVAYCYPEWFNPWQLGALPWIVGGFLLRGAIAFYDFLVIWLVQMLFDGDKHLLPTRTTGKPVRYVTLDTKSMVFLVLNSIHEWIFVQRLCHFLWYNSAVPQAWQQLTILNTVAATAVMFIVLDLCYAPCHHILHQPWCYPLIHKHHHRQHYPVRGYLDAGNEHPIEHMVGVASTWAAVLAATATTGAHAATIFFFFNIHAALAMLNHSPYNVKFSVLGLFTYSVAAHEMHHRKFTVNYAQYCLWYDHVMQTYAAYEGPLSSNTSTKNSDSMQEEKVDNRAKKVS